MSTQGPSRILLDPANPNDFSESELSVLAAALVDELSRVHVVPVFREEAGYGGPLQEVLHVWLEIADSVDAITFAMGVAHACGEFMRRRWSDDRDAREDGENPRKRSVNIYGPDDRLIMVVEVDLPDGDPQERLVDTSTPVERLEAPHPRPRAGEQEPNPR